MVDSRKGVLGYKNHAIRSAEKGSGGVFQKEGMWGQKKRKTIRRLKRDNGGEIRRG